MKDLWPKGFDAETIASVQSIQDSLADLSAMYLAVVDPAGAPLTIPSNQSARCTECQARFAELPCLPNIRQAIADTAANRTTSHARCPFGLLTYFSPLGTLGNPSRGSLAAILAIGKLPAADRPAGSFPHAHVEKTVATFCRIFDLVFSLPARTGLAGTDPLAPAPLPADTACLSAREREVLHLVALGLSNRTIADRLFISETTVKTHVHNILQKVKITNRTSLALFFLQSV